MSLAKNVTATAAITGVAGVMRGFYVNSTTAGTIVVRDGDANGVVKSGTITPAVGWHDFPLTFQSGLHVTIGGALNVTIFYDK